MRDTVDEIVDQWTKVRPDLDVSPMAVVGRLSRASRLLERGVKEYFAGHGLESWEFDVLATLRRAGEPYTLTPGDLARTVMIGSSALTNRVDRLVARGLVTRETDPENRRRVLITLTSGGLVLVDQIASGHYLNEDRLLSGLTQAQRDRLGATLRTLLISLGDTPPEFAPSAT
ncbi:MAG TPA: MarR family transcriptional regulator [Jiangellaceae bacterium]|nr:MarR family transcriptional regulator [Jiangellaceae bacterium]